MASQQVAVNFRKATNEDRSAVVDLMTDILGDHGVALDFENTDSDLNDLEKSYAGSGGGFWVLLNEEGAVIGSVGLAFLEDGVCELRKMYLSKDYRGQGLGKLLLMHATDQAKALGFSEIELETANWLKEALQMYQKNGFEECEPRHLSDRCDVAMRKVLG